MKVDNGYTPGRRKANQLFKMAVHNLEENGRSAAKKLDVDIGLVYSLGPKFPDYRLNSPESNELIVQLMHHLDQRIQKRSTLLEDYGARREYFSRFRFVARFVGIYLIFLAFFHRTEAQFRMQLMQIERDNVTLRSENATLNGLINLERNKTAIHEKKIETMESHIDELSRRLRERDNQVKDLQKQLNQKQYQINQKELENEKQKRKFSTKMAAEAEKMNRELSHKFRAEKDLLHVSLRCASTSHQIK